MNELKKIQLPFQINISFKKVYDLLAVYASEENKEHPFYLSAYKLKAEIDNYPFLIDGFSDFSLLDKYKEIIQWLTEPLFPEILQTNEIKAASIPFVFENFRYSKRFEQILNDAGDDFELTIKNFDEDLVYQSACTFILAFVYGYTVDLKRPFYFDIPDKNGVTRHYRLMYNADFTEIYPTENAPKITEKDYRQLIDNFDDIKLWKEKFPPESYIFKGFGIMNLFDVTTDMAIANIHSELLHTDEDLHLRIQNKMQDFFQIPDLKVGFSMYELSKNNVSSAQLKRQESMILSKEEDVNCKTFFCSTINKTVFKEHKSFVISDVDAYGKHTNENQFYKKLKKEKVGSIIIIPIVIDGRDDMLLMEFASPRALELNSVVQSKLQDVLPAFKTAVERSTTEFDNQIEAIIQENYTSIHPTVKWRFVDAAQKYLNAQFHQEEVQIDDIVFDNVFPLYGQSDIKGSSLERNEAIKEDLITQLSLAISVLQEACKSEKMPIYKELMFRVDEYLSHVKNGLQSGDETTILSFLKREIYPVFKHIKTINNELKTLVKNYINRLDDKLHVVYEKRKDYEQSVTILNDKLSNFIDRKQHEAQGMFPHYFERYKTDGVEYNMYIGQSLVKNKKYNELYLYNLRLWQLQLMCEMENVAMKAIQEMEHELRVASLILVHSNPLAIKFRMDEKQFDVDGAYNIRYEIIKKRIDKAHIKGTEERLTVPNKISIVYAQEKDALEYKKYIKYLQSKNKLGKLEMLELEDLQGVSGLKAMRVEVIYDKNFNDKNTMTINELIKEFN